VQRKAADTGSSVGALASLQVSSPSDPAEREAQTTAQRIVNTATPDGSIGASRTAELQRSFQSPYLMRFAGSGIFAQTTGPATQRVYRKEQGQPTVTSDTAADIRGSEGGGSPLPLGVRQFMEPRFGADFSGVKIHTGDKSASLNRQLSADAFAVGNNVFFGKDKFQPGSHEGRELIAHELTHTLQQGTVLRRRTVEVAGKTMYVASDGELVELPPDMTDAEATKLEAQAKAAEKKLGKGPAPKPVPDVKKLAKKVEKKGKPKPGPKGKKSAAGKGKGGPKGGAGMAKLKVGPGKVAQYLAAKATPTLAKGIAALQKLKQNEQTHDDAAEKLKQSEKAVVIPPSEGQSKSNTGQVATVNSYPPPAVDDKKGKQQLQDSLEANFPQTIEDVDNFKRDRKAQHMGADVMKVVQADKNAVSSTFQEMEQTPPPIPPETPPEALPPEELAPPTANMDLGQGAVPSLQKQHTDVSSYSKEADARLKEEGVTQEQLDMVDSGDLAEANKEKKGLQQAAQTQPLAVQKFAQREAETVQKDLKQEEKKERDALKTKRKAGLSATAKKQLEAKKALEKKREEVASKINGIFQTAQDSVKKKLADLENESMKRFDDGNAQATRQFEDNVNRELGAFKAERYSGWFGRAKKAKDWLWGMDELPEVKAIFDSNRTVFVNTINKLVEDINIDNKRVIQECKDELAAATKAIKEYVDTLEPGLKDIGNKTAEEMNGKLQELDQFVNKKEEELRDKLKDKQTAAIKAIDEKIEKMKEAMSGALSKLGKLLLAAAKKFFTWALEKCGVSLSTIEGIINKGTAVLKAIFTQPIKFVKNLMNAAITGFKNFGSNFLKHLKDALFEWLTGSLEGLKLPQTWDLKGIIGVALQMIGITYDNLRKHMVTEMTEPVVAGMEKGFALVQTLVKEGPMAAWEQLKEMAGEMRDAFVDAVKDFIKQKIIEEAIKWLVSLFVPGAGLIKAALGIYDTIVFFIQKAKQIIQMVSNFLGSISEIAAGNIAAAADAMEKGLARGLSLVISFLAQLLRMSGITDKIKKALEKIRGKVDAVLLKVAKWVADKGKKLYGAGKAAAGKAVETIKKFVFPKMPFQAEGKTHHVTVEQRGESAELVVTGSTTTVSEHLYRLKPKCQSLPTKAKQTAAEKLRTDALALRATAATTLEEVLRGRANQSRLQTDTEKMFNLIRDIWKMLGVDELLVEPNNREELEVDRHGSLAKDNDQQNHHVPQNAIMKRLRAWLDKYVNRPQKLPLDLRDEVVTHRKTTLSGLGVRFTALVEYKEADGVAIRMLTPRHHRTRTFGTIPDENLDIKAMTPRNEWVKSRPIHDERIKRYVVAVRGEFDKDKDDVFAIYSGRKGLPKITNIQKVTARVGALGKQNAAAWGSFLER